RICQLNLRDFRYHVIERPLTGPLANLELTIRRIHIGGLLKAVGQPRCMTQQIDHQHRAPRRFGPKRLHEAALIDTEVAPFGNQPMYRIVECDQPLLDQHHERDARDRLAHRVDAKNCVGPHGLLTLDVGETEGAEVGEVAAAKDGYQRAGNLTRVDIPALEITVEYLQALRRDARGFGIAIHVGPRWLTR